MTDELLTCRGNPKLCGCAYADCTRIDRRTWAEAPKSPTSLAWMGELTMVVPRQFVRLTDRERRGP